VLPCCWLSIAAAVPYALPCAALLHPVYPNPRRTYKPTQTVHSLDLVATAPGVVACNMAHTPLGDGSCDVAVFRWGLSGLRSLLLLILLLLLLLLFTCFVILTHLERTGVYERMHKSSTTANADEVQEDQTSAC